MSPRDIEYYSRAHETRRPTAGILSLRPPRPPVLLGVPFGNVALQALQDRLATVEAELELYTAGQVARARRDEDAVTAMLLAPGPRHVGRLTDLDIRPRRDGEIRSEGKWP